MKPANSVTAQNERIADELRQLTMRFRNRDTEFPAALYDFLADNGVDPMRSVMLFATSAEQGTNPIVGHILSQDRQFFDFDLDCDAHGQSIIEIHEWADKTSEHNMSSKNPGYGKGQGCIAIEVQRQLNNNDI